MATDIGSVSGVRHQATVTPVAPQQVKPTGRDADGDNDGTKAGQVDKLATSGTVGTNVKTTA